MKKTGIIIGIVSLCLCLVAGAAYLLLDTGVIGQQPSQSADVPPQVTESQPTKEPAQVEGELKAHFIDVGQADCEFIELPDGKTMLIDAGNRDNADDIISYIKALDYEKLDYVVATHPHADHIGGMAKVIKKFDVGKVYMPRFDANTKSYENLLSTIADKGLKIKKAEAGVNIATGEYYSIDILAPVVITDDSNNNSAVVKITFGNNGFLFMGDAEEPSEKLITADVSCDLVKVGHHGSSTSSSENFVKRTGAKSVIISVGKDNSYNHPSTEAIKRWADIGALIYRTDKLGTIIAKSDGNKVTVYQADSENGTTQKPTTEPKRTEKPDNSVAPVIKWILNTYRMKIHRTDCPTVNEMSVQNRVGTEESYKSLVAGGYEPCQRCRPDIEVKWILDKKAKVFHTLECRAALEMDLTYYTRTDSSYAELINKGYSPCQKCNPAE